MQFSITDARAFLQRTPSLVRLLIAELPPAWLDSNEGPDSWSPREVLAHLTDLEEQDWIPRLSTILKEGDARPLAPVDRVRFRSTLSHQSIDGLLQLFAKRRSANLQTLASFELDSTDFERRGLHPVLGTVTLQQLLATWVVHDQTHLAQIIRVIARQYADEVGPWERYLGILQWRKTSVP